MFSLFCHVLIFPVNYVLLFSQVSPMLLLKQQQQQKQQQPQSRPLSALRPALRQPLAAGSVLPRVCALFVAVAISLLLLTVTLPIASASAASAASAAYTGPGSGSGSGPGVSGSFMASFKDLEAAWAQSQPPSQKPFLGAAGSIFGGNGNNIGNTNAHVNPAASGREQSPLRDLYLHRGSARPSLPLWFRLKARVWHKTAAEPVLLVLHYDGLEKRSREDWFTLVGAFHRRYATDIKDYKTVRRPITALAATAAVNIPQFADSLHFT